MKKILITGGAGFIGYHLARSLVAHECDVWIADNLSRGVQDRFLAKLLKEPNCTFRQLDGLQPESLQSLPEDFDIVFHLAAIIGVQHVESRPYAVLAENIRLLENIIEWCHHQKNLHRFLFASTSEVYAGSLEANALEIPTPEDVPIVLPPLDRPRTSYLLSKISGEALCFYSGLPITIFRPHNIYGPRMGLSHVIPQQLQKAYFARDGDRLEIPGADQTRSFCFVEDAVKMLVEMMDTPSCDGKVLNLGREHPESRVEAVVTNCWDTVGKNLISVPVPASAGSPDRRCPSMEMTFEHLKARPCCSLEEGISRTFEWYEKEVFSGDRKSSV